MSGNKISFHVLQKGQKHAHSKLHLLGINQNKLHENFLEVKVDS